MEEFLMPDAYTGPGAGLGVIFAGLAGPYEKLEISIDGGSPVEARQDPDDPFYSAPCQFSGLEAGRLYQVCGRVTTEDGTEETSCAMPAVSAQRAVTLRSAPAYCGGGRPAPLQRPKVRDG